VQVRPEDPAYVQAGFVDPRNLRFTSGHLRTVRDVVPERAEGIRQAYVKVADDVFRNHPFYEPSEQIEKLRRVLKEIAPPKSGGMNCHQGPDALSYPAKEVT
jgi:hypothetical protein